jgi:hypothetical protein
MMEGLHNLRDFSQRMAVPILGNGSLVRFVYSRPMQIIYIEEVDLQV